MKRLLVIAIALLSANVFAGELNPEVGDFNQIKILGNYKVYLTKGDAPSVKIINNDAEVPDENIETSVKKGVLEVKIKKDNFKLREIEVHITYKELIGMNIRRGAWVNFENDIKQDSLEITVSSGGTINGNVELNKLSIYISKSGSTKLNGTATKAVYKIQAGGEIYSKGVVSDDIDARVNAGGYITVSAHKKLYAKVLSGGSVKYYGDPTDFTEEVKLGGVIKQLK